MKFKELENLLNPCYALLTIILVVLVFIGLVLFFEFYDKNMRIKQRNENEHIKDIVNKTLSERENKK